MIPKPGEFSSQNHRPITCLNNLYKWYTLGLPKPTDEHLNKYGLMQGDQGDATKGCAGTVDNLLIDRDGLPRQPAWKEQCKHGMGRYEESLRQCKSSMADRNVLTTQIPTLAMQEDPKAYNELEY